MKLFSFITKKSQQKYQYLKNIKTFQGETESIFHILKDSR